MSTGIQVVLPAEGGPQDLQRRYVQAVLSRYLWLPDTPGVSRRQDRRLACEWYKQGIPLIVVEAALLLAGTRRALRSPQLAPLPSIRALHYFDPLVDELLEEPSDPDPEYLLYLVGKLRPLAELKLARLRHQECYGDQATTGHRNRERHEKLCWRREGRR